MKECHNALYSRIITPQGGGKTSSDNWSDENPLVTILTPVYNRRKVLPRALAAVESQTYRNIEYIIVDDGSAESIDDIVIPFAERVDFPVLYL